MWFQWPSCVVVLAYSLLGLLLGYSLKYIGVPSLLSVYGLKTHAKYWRYFLFEGLAGLCGFKVALYYGTLNTLGVATLVFFITLLALAFIDAEHFILPDILVKPLWILGLVVSSQLSGFVGCYTALASSIATYGIFRLLSYGYFQLTNKIGLGQGDIKLLSVLDAWFGLIGVFIILQVASMGALIWGLTSLYLKKQAYNKPIPFGPFLVFATFYYFMLLQPFSTT